MPELLRIRRYGVWMCPCMIATLPMIEQRLRGLGLIRHNLAGLIFQGCWNTTVTASAGTHDGGGAIDVHPSLATTAGLTAWRESGVAMWHRQPIKGLWGEHAHGIWIGCPHLSSGAKAQVTMYRDGYNGLASWGRDTGPRVGFITWQDALTHWQHSTDLTEVEEHPMAGMTDDEMDRLAQKIASAMAPKIRHNVYAAMKDWLTKYGLIPNPMGPGYKGPKKWTVASTLSYLGSWGRLTANGIHQQNKEK